MQLSDGERLSDKHLTTMTKAMKKLRKRKQRFQRMQVHTKLTSAVCFGCAWLSFALTQLFLCVRSLASLPGKCLLRTASSWKCWTTSQMMSLLHCRCCGCTLYFERLVITHTHTDIAVAHLWTCVVDHMCLTRELSRPSRCTRSLAHIGEAKVAQQTRQQTRQHHPAAKAVVQCSTFAQPNHGTPLNLAPCLIDADPELLQRAYGVAFPTADKLKQWKFMMEEARRRDHRVIGKQQHLFMFHELRCKTHVHTLTQQQLCTHSLANTWDVHQSWQCIHAATWHCHLQRTN